MTVDGYDPIAMYSRYGVLDVEGGGDTDAELPLSLVFIMAYIQWNIRGLQANREEVSLLLSQ